MVNGVPLKLIPEPGFADGRSKCVQLPSHGSFLLNCRDLEIGRRNYSIKCKLRNGGGKVTLTMGKAAKRKVVNISGSFTLIAPKPGNVSSQSAASPASNMDMADEHEDEIEADDDDELCCYRGLILDLAYKPINVVNWKRSLCLDILEKAEVLEYYDHVIYSPNRMFFIPAVLKVTGVIHSPRHKQMRLSLNRKNIFLRDKFRCQYCNANDNLTIDHVYAASKGGGWTWDNLVTACSSCNVKKASKTVEEAHMTLIKAPKEPKLLDSSNLPPNYKIYRSLKIHDKTPTEWLNYLPRKMPMFQ